MIERPGLLKTTSSTFVFIAAFLAVSNYLGGGVAGLTDAAAIALVVTLLYFLFYGWIVPRPADLSLSPIAATPIRPRRIGLQEADEPDTIALLTRGVRNVCDTGPYQVEARRPTKIALSVEPSFMLLGTLEEEDGDDFEWMIVDEDNWVRYQQGREFVVEGQGNGESTYKVRWTVPRGGPWFLILEAQGKHLVREVHVNLRLSAVR